MLGLSNTRIPFLFCVVFDHRGLKLVPMNCPIGLGLKPHRLRSEMPPDQVQNACPACSNRVACLSI